MFSSILFLQLALYKSLNSFTIFALKAYILRFEGLPYLLETVSLAWVCASPRELLKTHRYSPIWSLLTPGRVRVALPDIGSNAAVPSKTALSPRYQYTEGGGEQETQHSKVTLFPSDAETSRIIDLISGQPANEQDRTLLLQRILHVLWVTFNASKPLQMTVIVHIK